ncbi:MAG: hypothetical protein ACOCTI_05460 [Phycisphaeraceae bacterium]
MTKRFRSIFCRAACLTLLITLPTATGCGIGPWMAHGIAGGDKTADVKAKYRGLENQDVAVLVAADPASLAEHPRAPELVSRAVSGQIAKYVPGIGVANPGELAAFQRRNPYWKTQRPSELIDRLDVDRLVLIDLADYRTHEPGNAHVWQGVIAGTVSVIEADAEDPDQAAFFDVAQVRFPEDKVLGVVDADDETIQLGMLQAFARLAGGFFYDHQITSE